MSIDYGLLYKELKINGFFSEYLPPCFKLDDRMFEIRSYKKYDFIAPCRYTMSRHNAIGGRRNIDIPEIFSFVQVIRFMEEKKLLEELVGFTADNPVSFSPVLSKDNGFLSPDANYDEQFDEAEMPSSLYVNNIAKRIMLASGARKILKLDISNFYGSIYTHFIPVIALGLETADDCFRLGKEASSTRPYWPSYSTYHQLDTYVRGMNLNRTNGLLVGPVISRILAESLLARIDKELVKEGIVYSRFYDDYDICLFSDDEAEVIGKVSTILRKYDLALNYEKCFSIDFPFYIAENLSRIFRKVEQNQELAQDDLMELFSRYLELEANGVKGAIKYLLKCLIETPLEMSNDNLFKAYLVSIVCNNDRALTEACSLLIRQKDKLKFSAEDVVRLKKALRVNLQAGNDLECIWLLYALIEIGMLNTEDAEIEDILKSRNELAIIMLIRKGFVDESRSSLFEKSAKTWILLYEMFAADLIDESKLVKTLGLNHSTNRYKHFKEKNMHFCHL